jgi:hypothetical protein
MSSLILPRIWTSQPQYPVQIDTNNPIGRSIDYFFTPTFQGDSRGTVANLPNGGISTVYSKYGLGKKPDGTSGYFSGPSNIKIKGTGSLSRFAVLRVGNGGSNRAILSSGGSGGEMWRITNNTDILFVTTNVNVQFTQAGIVSANEYCILVSVSDLSTNTTSTYKNGILVATSSGTLLGGDGTVSVGQSGINSFYADHEFYLVGSVNRALSSAEAASLSANPWQIFKAKPRRLWVADVDKKIPVLSAATAVNITSTTATPQCVLTF